MTDIQAKETISQPAVDFSSQLAESFDHKGIIKQLTALGGCSYMPQLVDMWTPERAFALYVIAQALSDIDPLDPQIPLEIYGSPKRLTDFFNRLEERRKQRVIAQQETEEQLRLEGVAIVCDYRSNLRSSFKARNVKFSKTLRKWKTGREYRRLHQEYHSKFYRHIASRDEIDRTNFALRWFEEDQSAVALWCDLADIDLSRCYRAVERRLLRLERCSIKIHQIITSLSRKPRHEKEIRTAKSEDENWQPFSVNDSAKRRRDKALELMQLMPRDELDIHQNSDRYFVENMRQMLSSASSVIGQRQLNRLQILCDRLYSA